MKSDYDLIVLGLGGIGSAAAYWGAERLGDSVLGIEQFELGHGNGGSEDHSRIIRLSYHTPAYVELARSAYEAWEQVEVESGEPLVLRTGGLDLAPVGASIGLDDYRASMTAAGVPFEELDSVELMRRWPQWQVGEDVTALYQEQSGIAMASRANSAHRRLATEHGADLLESVEVESVREVDGEVEVVAGGSTYRAGQPGGSRRGLDQSGIGGTRCELSAGGHPGAGGVPRPDGPHRFPSQPIPDLDLDGRAQLLRVPHLRGAGGEGGLGPL